MLGYMRGDASTGAEGGLCMTARGGGRGVASICCGAANKRRCKGRRWQQHSVSLSHPAALQPSILTPADEMHSTTMHLAARCISYGS